MKGCLDRTRRCTYYQGHLNPRLYPWNHKRRHCEKLQLAQSQVKSSPPSNTAPTHCHPVDFPVVKDSPQPQESSAFGLWKTNSDVKSSCSAQGSVRARCARRHSTGLRLGCNARIGGEAARHLHEIHGCPDDVHERGRFHVDPNPCDEGTPAHQHAERLSSCTL